MPFGGLLEEIVVWEILPRLPPKSLLRCRAVCRSCRRELASPAFLLAHHRHQPSLPLVLGFPRGGGMYQDILALDCRAAGPVARLQPVARLNTAASFVDGLLILSHLGRDSRVCNPVTREDASLGAIRGFTILGFYPHRPTGEYRLLLYPCETMIHEGIVPAGYYVLALGCDLPRCIGWSAMPPCLSTPVLVHVCLHWIPAEHQSVGGMITIFDTMAESFRRMRAPSVPNREHQFDVCSYLFEMDDTLGIYNCSDYNLQSVDIWVLKNYERQVWEFKHMIKFPMAEIRQMKDRSGNLST